MNSVLSNYSKEVRLYVPCSDKTWNKISKNFNKTLDIYHTENPNPTEFDLIEAFGTPQEMAYEILKQVTISKVKKERKSKVCLIGVICGVSIVVGVVGFSYGLIMDKNSAKVVTVESKLIVGPEVEVPDNENLEDNEFDDKKEEKTQK